MLVKSWSLPRCLFPLLLAGFSCALWAGSDASGVSAGQRVRNDAREAGHSIAHGASQAGHAVAEGARDVGHFVRDGLHAVGSGVKKGVHEVGSGVKKVLKPEQNPPAPIEKAGSQEASPAGKH